MSQTKIIKSSADIMSMMMWIYIMPETGAYEIVESNPSSMDDASAHVLK